VNFVIIDLDHKLSAGQQQLVDKYFRNLVPHVLIVDGSGKVVYNQPGEVEEDRVSGILEQALRGASRKP
jgi:thioredoxin-related protein